MTELQQLLQTLGGDHGRLAAALAWIASARLALKPFGLRLQALLDDALKRVHDSPELDDDALVLRLLGSRAWRWLTFLLDLLISLKLPTTATFSALFQKPSPTPTPPQ